MADVRYRGTKQGVVAVARQVALRLSTGTGELAEGVLSAIGFAALSDIKDAFVVKAQGGTDEAGIRWPPLKPETIANRRIGRQSASAISKRIGPNATKGQILEAVQESNMIKRRERIRKRETKKALKRFMLSLPEKEAQRRARIVGGIKAAQAVGKTKVELLGGRKVEILRDTGILLNSLSPGELKGGTYTPPADADEQVFRLGRGEVVVGTSVRYASTHQHGSQNVPARPFLPEQVPDSWKARWLRVANKALAKGVRESFR